MNENIKGLHHIAIICSNREKALRFYGLLGFIVKKSYVRPERMDEIIMMDGFGITLELFIDATHPPRVTNPEAMGLRHLALRVRDIDNIITELELQGYKPEPIRLDTFIGEKMTFIKDPDGLPIELHE
jgi:glyoxylase I family protein